MHSKPRHTLLALLIVLMGILNVHIGRTQDGFSITPQWSFDGERVALVEGMSILIYEVESGAILHRLDSHTDAILSIDWSPVDYRLVSASNDQTVKIWDGNTGELLRDFTEHNEAVGVVRWSTDGTHIISTEIGIDIRSQLLIWNANTGIIEKTVDAGSPTNGVFSPNGSVLALSHSLALSLLDGNSFQRIIWQTPSLCCQNRMETLAWSPDGSQLVTGSINGLITLWDATTLTQITQFATTSSYPVDPLTVSDEVLNRYWIRDTAFNVDGVIETVSGDGTVRQWDTQGNLLQETQIGQLETAAWSPYGARLAVQMPSQTSSNGLRTVSGDTFRIEVPFASMDQLNAIAALCVRDASTQSRAVTGLTSQRVTSLNALPDFVAQVESLPEGAIPAACRADLLAVAEALR